LGVDGDNLSDQKPPKRRCPLGTNYSSNPPARSRGTSISNLPSSLKIKRVFCSCRFGGFCAFCPSAVAPGLSRSPDNGSSPRPESTRKPVCLIAPGSPRTRHIFGPLIAFHQLIDDRRIYHRLLLWRSRQLKAELRSETGSAQRAIA